MRDYKTGLTLTTDTDAFVEYLLEDPDLLAREFDDIISEGWGADSPSSGCVSGDRPAPRSQASPFSAPPQRRLVLRPPRRWDGSQRSPPDDCTPYWPLSLAPGRLNQTPATGGQHPNIRGLVSLLSGRGEVQPESDICTHRSRRPARS